MALIWRLAVLGLLPLAIITHVETRSPRTEPAPSIQPAPIQIPPRHQAMVICPFGGPCWQDGRRLKGALGGNLADDP